MKAGLIRCQNRRCRAWVILPVLMRGLQALVENGDTTVAEIERAQRAARNADRGRSCAA